jgi:hypothetical protein
VDASEITVYGFPELGNFFCHFRSVLFLDPLPPRQQKVRRISPNGTALFGIENCKSEELGETLVGRKQVSDLTDWKMRCLNFAEELADGLVPFLESDVTEALIGRILKSGRG